MKLPFSLKKKEPAEYIVSLIIRDTSLTAVIFETENGAISVFAHAKKILDNPIAKISHETLLNVCDKVISSAEQHLPKGAVLKKTIFSLPQEWVIEGKIKREFVSELKKICEELSLEPIGFLVLTEAVLHALQKQEGAPVSAIVVELGSVTCSVSLARAGRIVEHKTVPLEDAHPQAVESALKHFTQAEILPARIIIFDGGHAGDIRHLFLRHTWSKTLPFLHVPQVTLLPKAFDMHAVLLGTATQMGFAVKNEHFLHEPDEILPIAEEQDQDKQYENEDKKYKVPVQKEQEIPEAAIADSFGFSVNKDVAEPKEEFAEIPEIVKEKITHEHERDALPVESTLLFTGVVQGIKNIFARLPQKRHKSKDQSMNHGEKLEKSDVSVREKTKKSTRGIIIGMCGVVTLIALSIGYIYLVHAQVIIGITAQTVEDTRAVDLVVNGATDPGTKTLGMKAVQSPQNGSVSADATGSKDIGTPAKGKITLFSRLTDTTDLPKGTTIIASNGLKFSLDSTVSIASFSGGPDDPSVNVSNVSVTANEIGPEYNFPSGTKFSIAGQSRSDMSAKSDSPFSGGTKSTITVVSQKDIDGLSSTLVKNLEQNARADMEKNMGGNAILLDGFTKEDVSQKKVDKNVGDKAKSVSLSATVTYEALTYNKDDVSAFGNTVIQNKVPSGMVVTGAGVSVALSDIKKKDGTHASAMLSLKAAFVPKVDLPSLQKRIAGKTFAQSMSIIKNVPQVNDVRVILTPAIPLLPAILPRIPSHIAFSLQVHNQ